MGGRPQPMERPFMRKLNVRLFLYLVGTAALLTVGVVVVHRLQAGGIAGALLWQAEQAEKAGRLPQAARYLQRSLEFAPEDLAGRARLGRILADPAVADGPK